jgi:hypothetical protein
MSTETLTVSGIASDRLSGSETIFDDSDTRPTMSAVDEDFEYRPLPIMAPTSLFLGLFASVALLSWYGVGLALLAAIFAALAWRHMAANPGEYAGEWLPKAGLACSLFFASSGSAWHVYDYIVELPEGYKRVSFYWLSSQQPILADGAVSLPQEVADLDGRNVYIKGYMYPMQQYRGLTEFVLCRDSGDCCFGGQPKITDMIVVRFENGMTVNHREKQLVGVGGTFRIAPGASLASESLSGIYTIEGTHFK